MSRKIGLAMSGLSPRGRGNHRGGGVHRDRRGPIPAWAGKPGAVHGPDGTFAAYPRVGGETIMRVPSKGPVQGLSPRGRGNRGSRRRRQSSPGPIPAWAGKPSMPAPLSTAPWAYPRVGGETTTRMHAPSLTWGLSPRGRGNRNADPASGGVAGPIPAWAGKPLSAAHGRSIDRAYPRVGGETIQDTDTITLETGLSPRGRGNPFGMSLSHTVQGTIPAWAGKPPAPLLSDFWCRDYPRVGGETMTGLKVIAGSQGLSPRGRGNLQRLTGAAAGGGTIPAWAGKP